MNRKAFHTENAGIRNLHFCDWDPKYFSLLTVGKTNPNKNAEAKAAIMQLTRQHRNNLQ